MNTLKIKSFKAFKNEITIDFQGKNLLVYGENGSGKSSIYEALKIIFFKPRLETTIESQDTPEEQEQMNRDFWSKYNNRNTNVDFDIEIDNTNYEDFSAENYQSFMISITKIKFDGKIKLSEFLKNFFFDINDIDSFCLEHYSYIQDEINDNLNLFNENIQVTIDREDGYAIKITDSTRNLESKNELNRYFNEAKLNLVTLLLLFNTIRCATNPEETKRKILILDDFITSLDVSNRAYLMRYILDEFSDFQIILFTHNVNFYNLIMYLIEDIYKINDNWNFGNIYELNNNNKLYLRKNVENVSKIKTAFKTINSDDIDVPEQYERIGNRIRKKFEVLLYEYSKLLMIGAVEDSKSILNRLENSKNLYFHNNDNKKTASDLVDEIDTILNLPNPQNLQNSLLGKINSYKQNDFDHIKKILKGLKLYRKITMNPMSHGHIGQPAFTHTEIKQTLKLLEILERKLKHLINSDASGM